MLNLKDVSSKLRMQGGTGCWIYGRVDQLLWNLFHGERWRSSVPIVKWPIRSLWMIQDTQRPLKLLYRSSIDCQNHNLDPKRLKNHLKYQYVGCWFGVESLQEIEGFNETAMRKIYMSPWSLFVWSCLIFAHSLGYHWEGNGFCPLRSPIEYHLLGGSTCSIILVIITQTPEITWVMTCNDHDVIPSLSYLGSVCSVCGLVGNKMHALVTTT